MLSACFIISCLTKLLGDKILQWCFNLLLLVWQSWALAICTCHYFGLPTLRRSLKKKKRKKRRKPFKSYWINHCTFISLACKHFSSVSRAIFWSNYSSNVPSQTSRLYKSPCRCSGSSKSCCWVTKLLGLHLHLPEPQHLRYNWGTDCTAGWHSWITTRN